MNVVLVPGVFTVRCSQTDRLFGFYRHIVNSTDVAFMEMQNICRYLSDFLQDIKTIWDMCCVMTGYTHTHTSLNKNMTNLLEIVFR